MPGRDPATLTKISLGLPFWMGKAEWKSDSAERKAAWDTVCRTNMRVAVQSSEGVGFEGGAVFFVFAV
jgi:hypothetical protein